MSDRLRHKPAVQRIMDLARRFRSASGDLYDDAYKAVEQAAYEELEAVEAVAQENLKILYAAMDYATASALHPHDPPGEAFDLLLELLGLAPNGPTEHPCGLCDGRGFYGIPGQPCTFCKGTGKTKQR